MSCVWISNTEEHCESVLDMVRSVPPIGGGVLPSEILAFVCNAISQQVDVVVESGRRNGYSTELLAMCLPECSIVSVDMNPIRETDTRLARYGNLNVLRGQGAEVVPKHVQGRTALLMDGPKGFNALSIIRDLRQKIAFGAIHDLCRSNECRIEMSKSEPDTWYTDDNGFVERYGHLDDCWKQGGYSSRGEMVKESFCFGFLKGRLWQ